MPVKPIPDGYHTVTPYLMVENVTKLIDFVKRAFEAEETERLTESDGSPRHVELRIGDSVVMMSPARDEWTPTSAMLYVYVEDTDATYRRALEAGATSMMEPSDQFYGDRNAGVKDPCGNTWWIATHQENVSSKELQSRFENMLKQRAAGGRDTGG